MPTNNHKIPVTAFKTTRFLVIVTAALVLASFAGQVIFYITGHDSVYGLRDLFDVENEGNLPTFFSSSLLLFAALLLGAIAVLKRKARDDYGNRWALLALVFLYLAVDEAAFIHELFYRPVGELLGDRADDSMFAIWIIPGIVFVVAVMALFVKFWLHLDSGMRRLFLASFLVYFGGAIGMESISSYFLDVYYRQISNDVLPQLLMYDVLTTIEEAMEMSGVIIMIYALLKYIEANYGEVRFVFFGSD